MRAEILKLAVVRACRSFMISMPIIVIYWQQHDLSMQDIFVLEVIFSFAIVVLEVPSGYFADRVGRRASLLLGSILGTLGFFVYYAAGGFFGFAVAEVILAVGAACMSGADSAFLYDTLQEHKKTGLFAKYQGRLMATVSLSEGGAAVVGGLLAMVISLQGVLFWQCIFMAAAIPVAYSLREPQVPYEAKKVSMSAIVRIALKENHKLRYLNLFAAALSASTLVMVWFVQPYWKELGVTILYFGVMWAGLNAVVSVGSLLAHRAEQTFRFRTLFGAFALAPLVLYGTLGLVDTPYLALGIIPLFWILRGMSQPIIRDYVNREVRSSIRATVLSINQLGSRLVFSVFSPFLGWVADTWSLQTAFLASALILGTLCIVGFVLLYGVMRVISVPQPE